MTERERFEEWVCKKTGVPYMVNDDNVYLSWMWEAWQAARRWIPVSDPPNKDGLYFCKNKGCLPVVAKYKGGVFQVEEFDGEVFTWNIVRFDYWYPMPEVKE